ncbi:hypothetical protein GPECTOR_194g321 [Gonium pectorale]|uniref:Ubiquitin carboxyl-terminal hydrolase n=1 Tax=Gonium pectorale TaxID=33097 RepID=A0A150FX15_GONPE|nr:hypothetical protein GPECTOR_194g321 [Gonium pectorale]|eukprot:KXZ42153.1 hypothetical protein GPECTOR_194g321 [Gonium pectorale]
MFSQPVAPALGLTAVSPSKPGSAVAAPHAAAPPVATPHAYAASHASEAPSHGPSTVDALASEASHTRPASVSGAGPAPTVEAPAPSAADIAAKASGQTRSDKPSAAKAEPAQSDAGPGDTVPAVGAPAVPTATAAPEAAVAAAVAVTPDTVLSAISVAEPAKGRAEQPQAEIAAAEPTTGAPSAQATEAAAPGAQAEATGAVAPAVGAASQQPAAKQAGDAGAGRPAQEKKGKQAVAAAAKKGVAAGTASMEEAKEVEDEEAEAAAASIPAGNNPWDLLGAASEDGDVAAAVAAAEDAAKSAAGGQDGGGRAEQDATNALRQLLSPVGADQLLAAGRSGGGLAAGPAARLQPRGLVNTGNTCFINSTMQASIFALLACGPFAAVLSTLPVAAPLLEPAKCPTLHGLALFAAELAAAAPGGGGGATDGVPGSGDAGSNADGSGKEDDGWAEVTILGKGARGGGVLVEQQEQQDAQEFFQFLVNRAHEEVVALRKAHGLAPSDAAAAAGAGAGGQAGNDGGDEEWAQVGRKNKATVTRQVGTPADDASSRSPLSAIFSGLLKSTVRFQPPHAHYKPSATIEAFNMLHLDIADKEVNTLEDALRHHSVPENIEYKPDGATEMLPAKKDVRLYRLPECLVLHLKRFTYTAANGGGYTKLHKSVAFGSSLRLEGKVLAEDCPDRANSEYRLFATVIHHGRSIAGGHYTADVLQPDGRWLRFNDAVVDLVPESLVLSERPYLLFYQRMSQRA